MKRTHHIYAIALAMVMTLGLSVHAGAAPIAFSGFSMETNGNAALSGPDLRLTPALTSQAGSAFITDAFMIHGNSSFSAAFEFKITGSGGSGGGADGITFTVQNDPGGNNALGSAGGGIGYAGITNSLTVEFDTFQNADPNGNHIGVNTNGNLTHLATATSIPTMESGSSLFAWIDYTGSTDTLDIFLGTTAVKPGSASLSHTVDLAALTGAQAFFGFTAATGGGFGNHDILDFSLSGVSQVPEPGTVILMGTGMLGLIGWRMRKQRKNISS